MWLAPPAPTWSRDGVTGEARGPATTALVSARDLLGFLALGGGSRDTEMPALALPLYPAHSLAAG